MREDGTPAPTRPAKTWVGDLKDREAYAGIIFVGILAAAFWVSFNSDA